MSSVKIELPLLCDRLRFGTASENEFQQFLPVQRSPLESLRLSLTDSLGATLTQVLYVLIVTVLDLLFVFGAYWLYRLLHKLTRPLFSPKQA